MHLAPVFFLRQTDNNMRHVWRAVHGSTGLLCDDSPESFAAAMHKLIRNKEWALEMGKEGRRRVIQLFSLSSFAERLDKVIREVVCREP